MPKGTIICNFCGNEFENVELPPPVTEKSEFINLFYEKGNKEPPYTFDEKTARLLLTHHGDTYDPTRRKSLHDDYEAYIDGAGHVGDITVHHGTVIYHGIERS